MLIDGDIGTTPLGIFFWATDSEIDRRVPVWREMMAGLWVFFECLGASSLGLSCTFTFAVARALFLVRCYVCIPFMLSLPDTIPALTLSLVSSR